MILKNLNKIIFIGLFFISCDEAIPPTISNGISSYYEPEMYLYASYTDKYNMRLAWYDYYCDLYNISIPEINYTEITGPDIQTYHDITNLNSYPGHYFTAHVTCSEDSETGYSDSVIVNTKVIDPIEDIIIYVEAGGYDDSLTFTHSSDTSIYLWSFYNFLFDQNNPNSHPHFFDISDSESGWEKDEFPFGWWGDNSPGWGTNKLDYYIYTKANLDDSYCYIIRVTDDKNHSRNSHIACSDNHVWYIDTPIEITSITNNLRRRIIIEWEEYINPDFYQYILWRSEYEDMPENSTEKLALIIESSQTIYHDRKNTSDGKKWYYKIEIQNQYGESEFSEIKQGMTRP